MADVDLDAVCLADPAFWKRPDKLAVFAAFRRERPVAWQSYHAREGGYWSVSRHADTRAVTKDAKRFVSAFGTGMLSETPEEAYTTGGMLSRDAPEHPALRRIVAKVFTPRLLAGIEDKMAATARAVVARISERGACDFATDVANRMPLTVVCDMLGVPEEDRDGLARLTLIALGYGDEQIGDMGDSMQAFLDLNAYGEGLARARRRQPGEDLITMMVKAEVDGAALSDRDIGIYFQLLITAGIETTASSIAQGMAFLARHPEQWAAWRGDFDRFAPTALEEIVRYASPVVFFGRTAAADTEVGGQAIAKGEQVVFWYVSANRDEAAFADPDRFDITRSPNDHVGYGGGGPHHCLGMHLARREMHHFFRTLFTELPDLEVDLDAMKPINGMFINGMHSLPCRFTPRRLS
jgi:methyl-branched lipid omega-hydroxylase